MGTLNDFARSLSNTYLNKIIGECVVNVKDNVATIMAMDLTSQVFVHTTSVFEHEDCKFGVGDLDLMVKYINLIKDQEVKLTVKEDFVTFQPDDGAKVKYLLADPGLIPVYEEEWEEIGDIIQAEIDEGTYGKPLELNVDAVGRFIEVVNMFQSNSVFINVDRRGRVSLHGGKETEHQFDVKLGKVEGVDQISLKLYGKNITSVLAQIDFEQKPQLYLSSHIDDEGRKSAVIIKTSSSSWMLSPLDENDTE